MLLDRLDVFEPDRYDDSRFENQYSAYPGIGAQASANYGVAFLGQPVGRQ
jgi:hypothetical protein